MWAPDSKQCAADKAELGADGLMVKAEIESNINGGDIADVYTTGSDPGAYPERGKQGERIEARQVEAFGNAIQMVVDGVNLVLFTLNAGKTAAREKELESADN